MKDRNIFILVLAGAFVLRLAGIGYGLPFLYHQDEPIAVNHAMAIGTSGDWNPHFFTNGPFPIYVMFVLFGGLFVAMKAVGVMSSATDFGVLFLKDPTVFYLLGRFVLGVLMGTLTVGWLMSKASKLFRVSIGMMAGVFLALCHIHVQNSHYIWTDIPLTFAATALLFQLIAAVKNGSPRDFFIAGCFWGMGLACKMTAVFLAPPILLALIMSGWGRPVSSLLRSAVWLSVGAFVIFFILSPFAVLDFKTFLQQMLLQKNAEAPIGLGFHFENSILQGVGLIGVVLACIGVPHLIKSDRKAGILTLFFVLSIYFGNSLAGTAFARRILPLVPALCFLAAWGWDWLSSRLPKIARPLILGITLMVTVTPALYSDFLFFQEDTRTQAHRWVEQHVTQGAVIVVDNRFFAPYLPQTEALIEAKKDVLSSSGDDSYITNPEIDKMRARRLEFMKLAVKDKKTYATYALSRQKAGKDLPLFMLPIVMPEAPLIRSLGAEYLIFNESDHVNDFHCLKKELSLELAVSFDPYRSNIHRLPFSSTDLTAAPHDLRELFSRSRSDLLLRSIGCLVKNKEAQPFFILLSGLFLFFLWPLIFLKSSFIAADFFDQHLPWAAVYWKAWQAGQLPFWTRQMACGFPLVAEGQIGALYLFNLIAFRFLPFLTVYTWSIPLHIAFGTLGFYLYARRTGLDRSSAFLGAALFAFGSGYGGCFYNTGSLRVLAWLPWCLFICESTRSLAWRAQAFAFGLLALIFSQQWTAGFSQMAVYSFFYVLAHECIAEIGKPSLIVRRAIYVVLAIGLGTCIALPQFLTSMELIGQSVRSHESVAFALTGSLPPIFPVALFFPQWGGSLGFSFYLGMLPLFFLLGALAFFKDRIIMRHLLLAAFFLLLALGKYNPIYRLAIEWTQITSMRNPYKFLFFAGVSLSLLAAAGFQHLCRAWEARKSLERFGKNCTRLFAFVILLPLCGSLSLWLAKPVWGPFKEWYVRGLLLDKGDGAKSAQYYLGALDTFFSRLPALFSYQNVFNLFQVALAIVSFAALMAWIKRKITLRAFSWLAALILFVDLSVFGVYLGTGFIGNARSLDKLKPDAVLFEMMEQPLRKGGGWAEFSSLKYLEKLPPNAGMFYGVAHAGGYSPLLLKNYHDLAYDLGIADASLGRPAASVDVWAKQRGLLDLMGARWIRSDESLTLPGFERRMLISDKHEFLYENTRTIPDIAGYFQWKILSNKAERLSYMKYSSFDPHREMIVSTDADAAGLDPSLLLPVAGSLKEDGGDRLTFEIEMPQQGLIFIRNAAYPGWRAEIDGVVQKWFIADHAFMGLRAGPGRHEVSLIYQPTNWTFATGAAIAGLFVAFAALVPFVVKK